MAVQAQAINIRLGLLVDVVQPSRVDWFTLVLRSLCQFAKAPWALLETLYLDLTPLDYAVDCFIQIGLSPYIKRDLSCCFPSPVCAITLVQALLRLGYVIEDCTLEGFGPV